MRFPVGFFSLALLSPAVSANQLIDASFEIKASEADLIVVATATSEVQESGLQELKVGAVLKGDSTSAVRVMMRNPVAELHVECCAVSERAVLLLKRRSDGSYLPVRGRFGVIPIAD